LLTEKNLTCGLDDECIDIIVLEGNFGIYSMSIYVSYHAITKV